MTEVRLFPEGTVPDCATAAWYAGRDRAPHLEQPLHRPRLEATADLVVRSIDELGLGSVVDLGAGDGGLLDLVRRRRPLAGLIGYDLQPSNIAGAAQRGVPVVLADFVTATDLVWRPGPAELGAVAVCTEVLEHLVDPHGFLARLAALHDGPDVIVASSPWNETNGGAYEFHLWAWDHAGYTALFDGNGWHVMDSVTVDMFQVIRAGRVRT